MYVNTVRNLSDARRRMQMLHIDNLRYMEDKYAQMNKVKNANDQFDVLEKYYSSSLEDMKAYDALVDETIDELKHAWWAFFGFGAVAIASTLYLIWDPLPILNFNNFFLFISVAFMFLQFLSFCVLVWRASVLLKV